MELNARQVNRSFVCGVGQGMNVAAAGMVRTVASPEPH